MVSSPHRIHILVTGASRGIGRAISLALAARGARIALHYHANEAAAAETLGGLAGDGHALFRADVRAADGVEALWADVTARFGHIDVLINNAGIYELHAPLETSHPAWRAAWERTLRANLVGPANLCHLAANAMAAAERVSPDFGRGRIVNISSRGAFRGEPEAPAYGASKAGLNALSQSLAKAVAPQGVYVYCVAPGWVATDMAAEHLSGPGADTIRAQHPLGRVASAEEIARTVAFCALEAPAAMTGAIIDVNGASYLRT